MLIKAKLKCLQRKLKTLSSH